MMHCTTSAKSTLGEKPRLFLGIKGSMQVSIWFFVTFAYLLFMGSISFCLRLEYTLFMNSKLLFFPNQKSLIEFFFFFPIFLYLLTNQQLNIILAMNIRFNNTYLGVEVSDSSYRYRAIKGEH